MYNEGRLCLMN